MACIFTIAVICGIGIGYLMGRNSAEKPVIAEKGPEFDMQDEEYTPDDPEKDYFGDELPEYGPIAKRVATIR